MSLELKREQVLKIFDEKINNHILGDLKILDGIQPATHGNGCTVPTAMLILSSLDFIGHMLRPSGNVNETDINLSTAFKYNGYFPPAYSDTVTKEIVFFYRHGMMHSFYPQQIGAMIYGIHKSNSNALLEHTVQGGIAVTSLNVNVLSSDFKLFIGNLHDEMKNTQDQRLLENMLNSFKIIRPDNFSLSSLTTSSTTTTESTSSFGVRTNK